MRRPPGEPPPRRFRRDVPRSESPFERLLRRKPERDPAPIIIGGTIAFLALVIVLVFVFSSISGGGGGGGGGDDDSVEIAKGVRARKAQIPGLPPGLAAFSDYVELETEQDTAAEIGLPLKERVEDGTGLGFYTFADRRWQRVADVGKVEQEGRVGFGSFRSVPPNLAVLRVIAETYQVAASLPSGGRLHPDAQVNIVSPRDYVPVDDGSLQGAGTQVGGEEALLVMPTIVASAEDTSAVVNDILADEKLRRDHAEEIVSLVEDGEYDGIDLEYSAVDVDLRGEFTSFVRALADDLHGKNKKLSLTLPPPGAQRQAYDWKELGQAADIIRVLPIADPVTYWEAMPDALSQVVQDVDPRKVLLVMSPFSIEDLGDSERPMGYVQAMSIAAEAAIRDPKDPNDIKPGTTVKLVARNLDEGEGASPMRWNDDAASVSFALGGTERRRIYIENSFSFRFKLEMVQAYGLGGVSVSDGSAGSDVANIWPAVKEFLASATVTLRRPNDNALVPTWQAPDGGDLGAGLGTTATWVAPKAGPYNLVLVVSDGERRFGRKTLLEVRKGEEASPTPIATFPPETPTPSPSPTPGATATPTPAPGTLRLQVGMRADGDDDDLVYEDPESTRPNTSVSYRIVIDNDSGVKVTITSLLVDGKEVTCETPVVGKTLEPEDGDAEVTADTGDDSLTCKFSESVGGVGQSPVVKSVTVTVEDGEGDTGSDSDTVTVEIVP